MATRIYCDHCGLPAQTSGTHFYGCEYPPFPTTSFAGVAQQSVGQQSVGQQSAGNAANTMSGGVKGSYGQEYHRIDLCNTCGDIWMKRVAALNNKSEPKNV